MCTMVANTAAQHLAKEGNLGTSGVYCNCYPFALVSVTHKKRRSPTASTRTKIIEHATRKNIAS